jgi:hypothetical protein
VFFLRLFGSFALDRLALGRLKLMETSGERVERLQKRVGERLIVTLTAPFKLARHITTS